MMIHFIRLNNNGIAVSWVEYQICLFLTPEAGEVSTFH